MYTVISMSNDTKQVLPIRGKKSIIAKSRLYKLKVEEKMKKAILIELDGMMMYEAIKKL